jgi:hypothetical protein
MERFLLMLSSALTERRRWSPVRPAGQRGRPRAKAVSAACSGLVTVDATGSTIRSHSLYIDRHLVASYSMDYGVASANEANLYKFAQAGGWFGDGPGTYIGSWQGSGRRINCLPPSPVGTRWMAGLGGVLVTER